VRSDVTCWIDYAYAVKKTLPNMHYRTLACALPPPTTGQPRPPPPGPQPGSGPSRGVRPAASSTPLAWRLTRWNSWEACSPKLLDSSPIDFYDVRESQFGKERTEIHDDNENREDDDGTRQAADEHGDKDGDEAEDD
jgi:hypothetical protein